MIRQIHINGNPLQMFTNKEGAHFEQLIRELINNNDEFKDHFNETYNLCVGLTDDLEVYVWGDEDSRTITLEPLNIL